MKQTPILYSTPMVQAVNLGTKTITRRLKGLEEINKDPDKYFIPPDQSETKLGRDFIIFSDDKQKDIFIKCPFGSAGDILWVRETHNINPDGHCIYKADFTANGLVAGIKWMPNIFLPKIHARIWLKIISIRVERLQDITEAEAPKEGLFKEFDGMFKNYMIAGGVFGSAVNSFNSLWEKINGPKSWELNPWVWRIEFERIDKPA